MKPYRNKIKLANQLMDVLVELKRHKLRQIEESFESFSRKCSDASKDSHMYHIALAKGWLSSARKITSRVSRNLADFSYVVEKLKEHVSTEEIKLPRLSDVYAELIATEQEFGGFNYDLKAGSISITTEPIILNDIALGAFEVKLYIGQINRLNTESPYRIIALDPNPAASDDCVTHPHVSSERLCEGDGYVAIRKSLEQGRVCDFFSLVVSILQTYNPHSPYISLDDWEGNSCYDCGYTVSGDDSYYCEHCDRDFCSSCSTYCHLCDTTICLGCSYECPECNNRVCSSCTALCPDCEETFCKDCLEEGLCQNCLEQRREQEDEEQDDFTEDQQAGTSVHSDSVG